jgi:hypothetical protein
MLNDKRFKKKDCKKLTNGNSQRINDVEGLRFFGLNAFNIVSAKIRTRA